MDAPPAWPRARRPTSTSRGRRPSRWRRAAPSAAIDIANDGAYGAAVRRGRHRSAACCTSASRRAASRRLRRGRGRGRRAHATYSCGAAALRALAARNGGRLASIHVEEDPAEAAWLRRRRAGRSPTFSPSGTPCRRRGCPACARWPGSTPSACSAKARCWCTSPSPIRSRSSCAARARLHRGPVPALESAHQRAAAARRRHARGRAARGARHRLARLGADARRARRRAGYWRAPASTPPGWCARPLSAAPRRWAPPHLGALVAGKRPGLIVFGDDQTGVRDPIAWIAHEGADAPARRLAMSQRPARPSRAGPRQRGRVVGIGRAASASGSRPRRVGIRCPAPRGRARSPLRASGRAAAHHLRAAVCSRRRRARVAPRRRTLLGGAPRAHRRRGRRGAHRGDGLQPRRRSSLRRRQPAHRQPRAAARRRLARRRRRHHRRCCRSFFVAAAALLGRWPLRAGAGRARHPARLLARQALHLGDAPVARRLPRRRARRRLDRGHQRLRLGAAWRCRSRSPAGSPASTSSTPRQDVAFDRARGLGSIPARFGVARALHVSRALHVGAVAGLIALRRAPAPRARSTPSASPPSPPRSPTSSAWSRRHDLSRVDKAFFDLNGYVSLLFAACAVVEALR